MCDICDAVDQAMRAVCAFCKYRLRLICVLGLCSYIFIVWLILPNKFVLLRVEAKRNMVVGNLCLFIVLSDWIFMWVVLFIIVLIIIRIVFKWIHFF